MLPPPILENSLECSERAGEELQIQRAQRLSPHAQFIDFADPYQPPALLSSHGGSFQPDGQASVQVPLASRATARGRLLARLARLIAKPSPLEAAERFAAHLAIEFPAVLAFLWHPSVDATNWRAEQAIRPAVVIRKVCGGNRTRHGADTQQVLASVVRTAHQRHLDLTPLIVTMLRSPRPTVLDALRRPPP